MVADPVGLNPRLRPWHRAGVEFLLADQAVVAPYSLCIAAPCIAGGGRIGAGLASANVNRAGSPAGNAGVKGTAAQAGGPRAALGSAVGASSGATTRSAPGPQTSPAHSTGQSMRPQAAGQASAPLHSTAKQPVGHEANQPLPYIHPDQWPAIWQQRLQKTAPAAVLWTYWALGEDMCVRPDPTRRALLQKMLADLGHPAGTHSFWPAALPQSLEPAASTGSETALYPAPEIFWSGVQHLKARALVVMGSPALKALELPARLRPFQQTRHHGTLVVVLRDVDFLAQETNRYDAVKAFLRQALAPFGR